MAKRRKSGPAPRPMDHTVEAVPWAIEFANTPLSEENWKGHLWNWFGVSVETEEEPAPEPSEAQLRGKRSPQWHYGGMAPTLAHICRAQESICETLATLADKGTVPRDVVERVNSYLMGLHGFKFHIISELQSEGDGNDSREGAGPSSADPPPPLERMRAAPTRNLPLPPTPIRRRPCPARKPRATEGASSLKPSVSSPRPLT